MAWLADLAGKAETLLNNLDEHAGVALKGKQLKIAKPEQETDKNQDHGTDKKNNHPKHELSMPQKKNISKPLLKKPLDNTKTKPKVVEINPHSMPISDLGRVKATVKRHPFSMNVCPKTMVGDPKNLDKPPERPEPRKIRINSLPSELDLIEQNNKMQNLVIENSMLKNELSKMNREVSELMDRLRKTEDELSKQYITNVNLTEKKSKRGHKSTLATDTEIHELQEKNKLEINKYKKLVEDKQKEISLLRAANKELDAKLSEQIKKCQQIESNSLKVDTESRHAHTVIKELKANLERSTNECQRLEKEWDSYKVRVKGMLANKDSDIKKLQEGVNLTEDTKLLLEDMDKLKQERDHLSDDISKLRSENEQMKLYIDKVEERCLDAERSVLALRDTFKSERDAKNALQEEIWDLNKNLTTLKLESARQILELKEEIKLKDAEINTYLERSNNVCTSSSSALNVADFDEIKKAKDQIEHLTNILIQRQSRVDQLLASNNMYRIQMEKLEAKIAKETKSSHNGKSDSIVNFHDSEGKHSRFGIISPRSCLDRLSVKIGVIVRRYPIFRTLILFYMIILHLWVFTVLLSSTPNLSYDFYGQNQLTKNTIKHVSEKR